VKFEPGEENDQTKFTSVNIGATAGIGTDGWIRSVEINVTITEVSIPAG